MVVRQLSSPSDPLTQLSPRPAFVAPCKSTVLAAAATPAPTATPGLCSHDPTPFDPWQPLHRSPRLHARPTPPGGPSPGCQCLAVPSEESKHGPKKLCTGSDAHFRHETPSTFEGSRFTELHNHGVGVGTCRAPVRAPDIREEAWNGNGEVVRRWGYVFAEAPRARETAAAYEFLAPGLVLMAVWMFYPLARSVVMSFQEVDLFQYGEPCNHLRSLRGAHHHPGGEG